MGKFEREKQKGQKGAGMGIVLENGVQKKGEEEAGEEAQ